MQQDDEKDTTNEMVADALADFKAIEYIAHAMWSGARQSPEHPSWIGEDHEIRRQYMIMAKRTVLQWVNQQHGTDYDLPELFK